MLTLETLVWAGKVGLVLGALVGAVYVTTRQLETGPSARGVTLSLAALAGVAGLAWVLTAVV
ncbi:hypothetical protein ACFYOG_35730 [Streptomyces sp. NPDC007818]|uniref:hypothetical protein n=1 Tax=Streptomyces sp. NPDC007818 TaxID=3364780 RepID=UPI0036B02C2D